MAELPPLVQALLTPEAYPHRPGEIELVQTQMSFIFLAGDYVYKVKKAVDLGYLDYTTLEKRNYFCHQEVMLNRRLCPEVYLGVAQIAEEEGRIVAEGKGEAMEYAVKMRRLPQERMMDNLLRRNQVSEEMVARARELVGDDVELMVDAYMTLDEEYTVRLAEALRPYRIKWLEDYILPENLEGYARVRKRLLWQTLATGEHWYTPLPFMAAASRGMVDIFQPDVKWVGGITASVRICHIAEAAGLSVITHGGMNYPYGQHLAFAMPAIPMGERSEGFSAPGVPLEEMVRLPGTAVIKDGYVVPSDAPGFGLEVTMEWLESAASR